MLETCFFLPCSNFQYQAGKHQKNVILYQYLATNGDAIITPAHSVVGPAWTVRKKSFLKILILETCKMPRTEILRIRNCFHINVIYFYLELMSKSVSLKTVVPWKPDIQF